MGRVIEAVYDGAVFRPAEPLTLEPNTRVWVVVETKPPARKATRSFLRTARAEPGWPIRLVGQPGELPIRGVQTMRTNTITAQQVIDLVMTLPPDRLVSVYDFVLFVKQHPLMPEPEADIFGETAEEIRADEEWWDQQFAASRDELKAIAREAAAEYRAGRTKLMEFTPAGRLAR